jgi:hypothetical protein
VPAHGRAYGRVGGLLAGVGAEAALAARVVGLGEAVAAGRAGAVDDAHVHGRSPRRLDLADRQAGTAPADAISQPSGVEGDQLAAVGVADEPQHLVGVGPDLPGGGCRWQRCTVHFLRDALGHVARAQQPLVSGAIRGILTAGSAVEARQRLGQAVDQLRPHAPKVARQLEDAEADLLAFDGFPAEHWAKLRSTNPLERVNREIGRRSDVVGAWSWPTPPATIKPTTPRRSPSSPHHDRW